MEYDTSTVKNEDPNHINVDHEHDPVMLTESKPFDLLNNIQQTSIKSEPDYQNEYQNETNSTIPLKGVQCPHCDLVIASKTILRVHIRRKHTLERPYQCSVCDRRFAVSSDKTRHEQVHFKDREQTSKCGFCKKWFEDSVAVSKHEKDVHSKAEQFICIFCKHQSHDFESALQHKKEFHSQTKIACPICKKSVNKLMFKDHIKIHRDAINLIQSHMEKRDVAAFHSDMGLNNYQRILVKAKMAQSVSQKYKLKKSAKCAKHKKRNDRSSFECRYCYARFESRQVLILHESKHNVVKNLSCKSCGDKLLSISRSGNKIRTEANQIRYAESVTVSSINSCNMNSSVSNFAEDDAIVSGTTMESVYNSTGNFSVGIENNIESRVTSKNLIPTAIRSISGASPSVRLFINSQRKESISETAMSQPHNKNMPELAKFENCENVEVVKNKSSALSSNCDILSEQPACYEDLLASKFSCVFCEEDFADEIEWKRHQNTHKPPFHCKTCSNKYKRKESFMYHVKRCIHRKDSVNPDLFCSYCCKQFNSSIDRKKHESFHLKRFRFQCRFCLRKFLDKGRFHIHEKIHTMAKIYKCKYCDRHFLETRERWRHEMSEHLKVPMQTLPYTCSVCDKGYKLRSALDKHMAIHLGESTAYQCRICSKTLSSHRNLKVHFRKDHPGQKAYSCKYCNKLYKSKEGKAAHEMKHTGEKRFVCEVCKKSFYMYCILKQHKVIHEEGGAPKPFQCPECGLRFSSKAILKYHHDRKHNAECVKEHYCSVCGKAFFTERDLRQHQKSHSGVKPFQCTQCGQCFGSRRALHFHELAHAGLKPYKCRFCEESFRRTSTRNEHERIHTNERPYKCSYCVDTFRLKHNKIRHERSHTGERPYPCRFCEKRFNANSDRKRHERLHTGDKPYKCEQCDTAFTLRATLRSHIRNIHTKN